MGSNERWEIKVNVKDSILKTQVEYTINATFDLYRANPQFGVLPIVDKPNAFHLAYSDDEKTKRWIELFAKSVTDYINGHFPGTHLQCSVKENVLTFKKTESKKD